MQLLLRVSTAIALLLCLIDVPARATPLDEEEDLQPGLLAEYRTLVKDKSGSLIRIDSKPAFTWGNSSPHPRIPPGPFEVTWTGILILRESDPIRLGAFASGEVAVTIDDAPVLQGRGDKLTASVEAVKPFARKPGLYRIRIRYRSLARVPARVQLWWEGKSFAREPLPATRLMHIPKELPAAHRLEEQLERGREAVARLGCARCHSKVFPGVSAAPPGPSLGDLGTRIKHAWLVEWLANPAKVRPGARMPALFSDDRRGFVERTLVAEYLLKQTSKGKVPVEKPGDHRAGKQAFLGLGCVACHHDPEKPAPKLADPERHSFIGLPDRLPAGHLAAFLQDPATRYPDGRMPKLPVPANTARNIAAYLYLWSKPVAGDRATPASVKLEEVKDVLRRLKVADRHAAGAALVREKGCARCHSGIGEPTSAAIAIRQIDKAGRAGCLSDAGGPPRFSIDSDTQRAILAYVKLAGQEKHSSPFAARQEMLKHFRCHRCHVRDEDRSAPLEEIARTIWIPFLYRLPYQRTPRLTQATAKFRREYLLSTIRDGVTGVRPDWYSYRMPSFGEHAETLVRALAEGDGNLPSAKEPSPTVSTDPTLTALGPVLVGFEGYSCASCHVWNGKTLAAVEPGTVGPELTSLTSRIRRDWFDRFLDDPGRIYPRTPMPAIFRKGEPAPLQTVLDGHAGKQKEAIWAYLAQGKKAASPKPRPPIPIPLPKGGPLVAQIPVQLPELSVIESICVVTDSHDAIIYDLGRATLHNVYTAARLLRQSNVWRSFQLSGTAQLPAFVPGKTDSIMLKTAHGPEQPISTILKGYDRLGDGVRVRWRWRFASTTIAAEDTLRIHVVEGARRLLREIHLSGLPARSSVEIRLRGRTARFTADFPRATITFKLPPAQSPAEAKSPVLVVKPDDGPVGPLERPGYRALLYPRPKTSTGEDLIMPSALAAHPRDGRLFIASMKLGDLFVLRDPHDNGKNARYESYANGLFQDVFGMLHDGKDLVVLHRRNLSRLRETGEDGRADRCDRIAALDHAVGNAYDWAYGLVRDRDGNFLFTYAPHASHRLVGSGSLLRVSAKGPDKPREIAFGFRNPLGWCSGPNGEVFFTDNQGEWVATNKLCHIVPGRFYGYPNSAQRQHAKKPMGTTTVWVPYGWAKSINGVAYDNTGGKFGPFAGQFFLAELMHGGAILRANVEKVNGVYQGACFPFWGKGLLGPLSLAFDPKGRLFVGSVTTPGWMGQPDRGALFRLDFTGQTPFEIQSIHIRPQGFRLVFTRAVDRTTAEKATSYQVEHHRYEYTGAYGSPEYDRTKVAVQQVALHADGRTVDLKVPVVKGRVHMITAAGVRSVKGETLVHPAGAYTVNEVPES